MVTWEVWKHRNACVFEGAQPSFSCSSRQCLMSVFFGAWQELPSSRSSLLGHYPGHLMSSRCGHGLFLCKSQPSGVSCTDYRGCLTSVLIPFFFPKWNDAQSSCTVREKNIYKPWLLSFCTVITVRTLFQIFLPIGFSTFGLMKHIFAVCHVHWVTKTKRKN